MKKFSFILFIPLCLILLACSEPTDDPTIEGPPAENTNGEETNLVNPIEVISFNIQFLGHFKNKQNEVLAEILAPFDLIFVQELVAPPFECDFPDGTPCKPDQEAAEFFQAMQAEGFSFVISPEDTGTNDTIHKNSSGTEWWVAFYKDERISPAEDLPGGFLADDRSNHPDFERVPFAFPFRFDGKTDIVFISTHLKPGHESSDEARRGHELAAIFSWIDAHDEQEKDFIVLGDMNIDDCVELGAVTPPGFRSLNDTCQITNTNPNGPRPYDHVIYNLESSGNEIGELFEVIDLIEAVRPLWTGSEPFPGDPYVHNEFRTRFSDHHPISFQILIGEDDD